MRTRSSSNLPVVSSSNSSASNPKRRNRRRSKQPFILEESPIDTIADQRTMAELLRAPTEGYAEAIVPRWENDPRKLWCCSGFSERIATCIHRGICRSNCGSLILAEQFELKHSLINMMTTDQFFGLENDNPHDHIRWFNKITSTIKYKDVPNSAIKLMLFPFSLAGAAHSTLEIAKLTHAVNQQTSAVTTALTAILKQFQATPPPASVKAVEEICVTCGGAHPYYQCLVAGGNTFPEPRDNIQGYVLAAALNYNQAITTRSGLVLDGPTVPTPRPFINPEEDERIEETLMDPDLFEYTIKVPPPPIKNELKCKALADLEVQHDIFDPEGGNVLPEKLLDLDSTKDLHPPLHVNPLSGSTTYSFSPNPLLKELADELALITFPLKYDDDLQFDVESDLKEIEFLLHQDIDSSLKDSIDQSNLANSADNFVSMVDAKPSTNNEDKVFNPCILIQEKPFEIITRVVQDKKLATSNASSILEDFDPPFYELSFFKEVL
nr:hypothetical protein [Tanacetum cinerariifolium]